MLGRVARDRRASAFAVKMRDGCAAGQGERVGGVVNDRHAHGVSNRGADARVGRALRRDDRAEQNDLAALIIGIIDGLAEFMGAVHALASGGAIIGVAEVIQALAGCRAGAGFFSIAGLGIFALIAGVERLDDARDALILHALIKLAICGVLDPRAVAGRFALGEIIAQRAAAAQKRDAQKEREQEDDFSAKPTRISC